MKLLLSSILLLLALPINGQVPVQTQKMMIRNFTGLDTRANELSRPPQSPSRLVDVDLSRTLGALTKRYGYDSVSTLTNAAAGVDVDSMWIYGAQFSDGERRLIVVGAIVDSGYGGIWVGKPNSAVLNVADSVTRIHNIFAIVRPPTFTMSGDMVFINNGASCGVVWDRNMSVAREFPPRAPGQPDIIPLALAGDLNGEYIYSVYVDAWDADTVMRLTLRYTHSLPIVLNNQKTLIRGLDVLSEDSVFAGVSGATCDSLRIGLKRTTALKNDPTAATLVWIVDTLGGALDSAGVAATQYTDSISDTLLIHKENSLAEDVESLVKLFNPNRHGYSAAGGIVRFYGAPAYIAGDTGSALTVGDSIYHGWLADADTLGYAYRVSFIDTVTGVESPLGAPAFIHVKGGTAHNYELSMPSTYGRSAGLYYNVYRAPIIKYSHDTTYIAYYKTQTVIVEGGFWDCGGTDCTKLEAIKDPENCCVWEPAVYGTITTPIWRTTNLVDTIYTEAYRIIGMVASTDTVSKYIDSLPQYAVYDGGPAFPYYEGAGLPGHVDYMFHHQGRLFAAYKSWMYWTGAGARGGWGPTNNTPVNENDGDIITAMWGTRLAIRAMKNGSSYNLYTGVDDIAKSDWNLSELAGHTGCIAPKSPAVGVGGRYYLSDYGVIAETEGEQLERTYNTGLVSAPIDNLDKLSLSTKRGAIGFYHDRKYMLCIGDTTYVWDERANGWSTWTLAFESATHFSTATGGSFVTADTMYFSKGPNLYRYGTSEYDNFQDGVDTTAVNMKFTLGPLLLDNLQKRLERVALWGTTAESGYDLKVTVKNEEAATDTILVFDTLMQRGQVRTMPNSAAKGFYLECEVVATTNKPEEMKIDGIDLYYIYQETKEYEE